MAKHEETRELPDLSRLESGDGITRRSALAVGAVVVGGAVLAGCGSSDGGSSSSGTSTSTGDAKPKAGGTLTLGMIGGGTAETLNSATVSHYVDYARNLQLYDRLFVMASDVKTIDPGLAEEAEANSTADVWTLHLRDGVTWHDGKPFTADDVIWTLKSWASPQNYANGMVGWAIDFKGVRKRDKLTVEVPLQFPLAQFKSLLTGVNVAVIQNGSKGDEVAPVGTGPFKYVSFTPGARSVFARFDDYWDGAPNLEQLIIDTSFSDETARNNALLSGSIDVAPFYPPGTAKQQQAGGQVNVLVGPSNVAYTFYMRVDKAPFADPRVRQAMKILTNRQELIDQALFGFGEPGNDVWGIGTEYYASDLKPREFDIEQAKSLLRSAGAENLTATLETTAAIPAGVECAALIRKQAAAAGVTLNLKTLPPARYFTPAGGFGTRIMGQNNSNAWPSQSVKVANLFLASAPYDITHWASGTIPDKGYQSIITQAMGELDATKANDLWHEFQSKEYELNGETIFAYTPFIDAAAKKVQGLKTGGVLPLNNFDLRSAGLA